MLFMPFGIQFLGWTMMILGGSLTQARRLAAVVRYEPATQRRGVGCQTTPTTIFG